jgi:hypothetical protein
MRRRREEEENTKKAKGRRLTQDGRIQEESGILLDVVVSQGGVTLLFQLLISKDQALLIRGNTFFVLDLLLDSLDGVRRFDIKGDGLA